MHIRDELTRLDHVIPIIREGVYVLPRNRGIAPHYSEEGTYRQIEQKQAKRIILSYFREQLNSALQGRRFNRIEKIQHAKVSGKNHVDHRGKIENLIYLFFTIIPS
jgi:hypothetical protein